MAAADLAILADVHGNALALQAVLADITRRGAREIVNLGDNANGPLEPAACVSLLRSLPAVHVRGNGDRMTGHPGEGTRGSARFAHDRLDEEARQWLRDLPTVVHGNGWGAFHATPTDDETYLLENLWHGRPVLASPSEISQRLGSIDRPLLLCGHTHLPRLVQLPDGRTVVNPGSVGLPAYDDATPVPHAIENGSPHARYALAWRRGPAWTVEFVAVSYDWRAAAGAARAAGWADWARRLETGYA